MSYLTSNVYLLRITLFVKKSISLVIVAVPNPVPNKESTDRVLNRFCEDGVLHRIVAEDGKQYFAVCVKCDDKEMPPLHHFHFRCTSCDTIECLPIPVLFSLQKGYKVKSVNCVLTGICSECS